MVAWLLLVVGIAAVALGLFVGVVSYEVTLAVIVIGAIAALIGAYPQLLRNRLIAMLVVQVLPRVEADESVVAEPGPVIGAHGIGVCVAPIDNAGQALVLIIISIGRCASDNAL